MPPILRTIMRAGLARRAVDFDTSKFHNLLGPKDVIAVAYQNAGFQAHALENLAGGRYRVGRRFALRLPHDGLGWHVPRDEIRASHAAFGIVRIAACSAGRDQYRSHLALIKFERLFQTPP